MPVDIGNVLNASAYGTQEQKRKAAKVLLRWRIKNPAKWNEAVRYAHIAESEGIVGAELVGFFGKLFKGVAKVAKGVGNVAKKVFSKKNINAVLNVAKGLGPAIGIAFPEAMPYIEKGTKIVDALQGAMGPQAKAQAAQKVQTAKVQAAQGDDTSQVFLNILQAAMATQQGAKVNDIVQQAAQGSQMAVDQIRQVQAQATQSPQAAALMQNFQAAFAALKAQEQGQPVGLVAQKIIQQQAAPQVVPQQTASPWLSWS